MQSCACSSPSSRSRLVPSRPCVRRDEERLRVVALPGAAHRPGDVDEHPALGHGHAGHELLPVVLLPRVERPARRAVAHGRAEEVTPVRELQLVAEREVEGPAGARPGRRTTPMARIAITPVLRGWPASRPRAARRGAPPRRRSRREARRPPRRPPRHSADRAATAA